MTMIMPIKKANDSAAILNADVDDGWTYKVVVADAVAGTATIEVYDDEGFYTGTF